MAKEKVETTKEAAASPEPKKERKSRQARPVNDNKAGAQEAKDLRSLVTMMNKANAPESSKDITAYAKETLKLVAKSQKAESAAFRREATKTLLDFREFVEKTEKLTEHRRSQLLSQIDNVSLDAKNAAFMLLSVAKKQAKNIQLAAHKEAQGRKLAAAEAEKQLLHEAKLKAVAIEKEAQLKSQALKKEQDDKFKAMVDEHKIKLKERIVALHKEQTEFKKAEDERKAKHKEQIAKEKDDLAKKKDTLKKQKEDHKIDLEKRRDDLAVAKSKNRNHVKNLREQLKQHHTSRMNSLVQERDKHRAQIAQQNLDLKTKRGEAAVQIKKMKNDLRDDHKAKMQKGRDDLKAKKDAQLQKNKERIQKIREMGVEHKIKLKKIIDEAKEEALLKKHTFKKKLQEEQRAEAQKQKNRDEFTGKIRQGIYEANPILHAAAEIAVGMGLHDYVGQKLKKHREKKEQAKLNKLNHTQAASTGAGTPATPPNSVAGSGAASSSPSSSGGSMFSGILDSLPSVSGILSGIGSVFTGIVGAFGKVGSFLLGGVKFLPIIGTVATLVGGIWSFIEGFNDASSLFGEKIEDTDYTRRIYSGFTNVVGSILGLFDTVAGWLGFDSDLQGSFKKKAVEVFNAIINTFKSLAGGLANLLEYIPGMGGIAKSLKGYSQSETPGDALVAPETSRSAPLTDKTKALNAAKDDLEASKSKAASVQVVTDNSVKQSSTTIVQPKLDTRNPDRTIQLYAGSGATGRW